MSAFLLDTFTESANTALNLHVGETGATWTKHPLSGVGALSNIAATDRIRGTAPGSMTYYASGPPAGADYDVSGVILYQTAVDNAIGVSGRMNVTADTCYYAWFDNNLGRWELRKAVAAADTLLGSFSQALVASTLYTVTLELRGTAIRLLVDGVERVSVTDSAITAAGKAGVRGRNAVANIAGVQLDSISAVDYVPRAWDYMNTAAASYDAGGVVTYAGGSTSTYDGDSADTYDHEGDWAYEPVTG